ncbi:MAG: exodeoxyribonuclease VII large subunit, partial [Fusobacteriaceae bacterium]
MGKIYSVTEFSKIIKRETETNPYLQEVFIGGELSSVTYYKSGHLYFNLKDKDSQIKCVAFNYRLKKIPDNLKEGDSVKIFCDVGFYEARGEMQLLVRYIEKENKMGELFLKLENLKKDMEKLGYFNLEHKKKLPKFPKNIGVVTSFSGAALQDIIKTIKKRDNRINIYVYPAKVQGYGS